MSTPCATDRPPWPVALTGQSLQHYSMQTPDREAPAARGVPRRRSTRRLGGDGRSSPDTSAPQDGEPGHSPARGWPGGRGLGGALRRWAAADSRRSREVPPRAPGDLAGRDAGGARPRLETLAPLGRAAPPQLGGGQALSPPPSSSAGPRRFLTRLQGEMIAPEIARPASFRTLADLLSGGRSSGISTVLATGTRRDISPAGPGFVGVVVTRCAAGSPRSGDTRSAWRDGMGSEWPCPN